MIRDLVSIIIPCYNASDFISDTLKSVLSQTKVSFEVIVVNDGSTDDSEKKILSFNDPKIKYIHQKNSGVSAARNNGFINCNGEYVIFFDADDIMTPEFIYSRLTNIATFEFICGPVKKFSDSVTNSTEIYRGTSANSISEILLLDTTVVTCPSNYLFKTSFLIKNGLKFNEHLSSTADKYFLLQCANFGRSDYAKECSNLLYRVHQNSMSHLLSKALVSDNEMYYNLINKNNLIPSEIKDKSLFLGYYMLSGANKKINNKLKAIKYGFKAFGKSPLTFMKKIISI
jgi:glycosyltransferase involved in cell wall biosynthesis